MPACCPDQHHLTPSGTANEAHGAALVLHIEALLADTTTENSPVNSPRNAVAAGPHVQAVT